MADAALEIKWRVCPFKFVAALPTCPYFSPFQLFRPWRVYISVQLFLFHAVKRTHDWFSGERVHVIQLPPLILQPVIYGRCETEQSSIFDAECQQVDKWYGTPIDVGIFLLIIYYYLKYRNRHRKWCTSVESIPKPATWNCPENRSWWKAAARVASIASLLTLSVSLKHLMLITSFFTVKKKIKRDYFNRWHSHGRNDDFIHRSLERLN